MDVRTVLDGYLRKAVHPNNHDLDVSAIDQFCLTLKKDPSKMSIARELLVSRIQSHNTKESLLALEALEECMESLGREFRSEINKFRFLNELIKMVSKKYNGDQTPREVSDRILNILLTWTNKYEPCDCDKIQEAYNLLATQGIQHRSQQNVIIRGPPVRHPDERGPVLDKEQQKLKQLISSGKPENFEKANLLIQNLYRDEERRTQMKSRRLSELQKVAENTKLLNEMLDQYRTGETSDDELAILSEIYESCESAHPTIVRLAEETQHSEEMLVQSLESGCKNVGKFWSLASEFEKIFEVNDALTLALDKYRVKVLHQQPAERATLSQRGTDESLTPFAMSYTPNITGPDPLDTLFDVSSDVPGRGDRETTTSQRSNYDDLSDIFSSSGSNGTSGHGILLPEAIAQSVPTPGFGLNGLKATDTKSKDNLMELNSILSNIKNNASASSPTGTIGGKPVLPPSAGSVTKKTSPTAAAARNSSSSGGTGSSSKAIPELDSIISGMKATLLSGQTVVASEEAQSISSPKPEPAEAGSEEDDPILAAPVPTSQEALPNSEQNVPVEVVAKPELKALADIVIDLDSIQPSREPSRTVLDDKEGLQITLNFAADHPRPDVTVIVISTINQGRTSIPSFQFDASVRKPCKLRLLAPSATSLPGTKPFRPPADGVTQVLLLANPTGEPVDLTCILTYLVGDDPDPIKESIIMQAVPSVRE